MAKKTKAKKRKDKFYHLAKETGYRARSAFKLVQLNKKFSFLQTSKVLIDLCAAPGGWLQVASQYMPVSSLIIGVDLVAIKPVPNCITFTEDITTDSCKAQLKKELHTWKVDTVLHDGAPNVGKNWIHDAFSQSVLTLHALKLACDFLRKGGWFVSKVFRSNDYQSLMWIFNQLFRKVHATKPQASRNESAEIFVVCQGFKAPDKIDKRFFDPKHAFQDLAPIDESLTMADFTNKKLQKKAKALGYKDDATILYEECKVSEYLKSDKPLKILSQVNRLVFDDDEIMDNPHTTDDIIDACKDLKVIGKREFRLLANWHKKIKKDKIKQKEAEKGDAEDQLDDASSDSEEEIEKKVAEMKEDEIRTLKRKKKVVTKERRKLRERMGHMAQSTNEQEDMELFCIDKVKTKSQLENLVKDNSMNVYDEEEENGYESDDEVSDIEFESDEENSKQNSDEDTMDEKDDTAEEKNPLVVPLEPEDAIAARQTDLWFSKDIFAGIKLEPKQEPLLEKKQEQKEKAKEDETHGADNENIEDQHPEDPSHNEEDEESSSDSDYDINTMTQQEVNMKDDDGSGFEVVSSDYRGQTTKLDANGLALGTMIATSKKRKRDIIDDSFNRYTFADDDLPDWFVDDEKKRIKRNSYLEPHVPQRIVKFYEARNIAVNAKTIKKAAEAKARKKRKTMKRMEKVKKQVENVTDSHAISNAEKASQIKAIYKKHGMLKKQKENVTYVFAKKGVGKKVKRPPGVKGKFKVVDRRMKSDLRGGTKKQKRGKRK